MILHILKWNLYLINLEIKKDSNESNELLNDITQ